MSKWIEVTMTSTRTVAVEVEDDCDEPDLEAQNVAIDAFGAADDVSAREVTAEEIDALRRHADETLTLD